MSKANKKTNATKKPKATSAFLKPKAGIKVRDPITGKHLSEQGEHKPLNSFWNRRLRDNDVEQTEAPTKTTHPAPAKAE